MNRKNVYFITLLIETGLTSALLLFTLCIESRLIFANDPELNSVFWSLHSNHTRWRQHFLNVLLRHSRCMKCTDKKTTKQT